jgi:hypothetical protein
MGYGFTMAGRHNRLSTEPEPTNLADIANDTSTTTLAVFLPAQHLTKQKIAFRSPETKAASVGDSTADLPCVGRRCSGRLPFSEASPGGGAGAVRSGTARHVRTHSSRRPMPARRCVCRVAIPSVCRLGAKQGTARPADGGACGALLRFTVRVRSIV